MDLEQLNILRVELHKAKTEAKKQAADLECKKMFIEALEMAILEGESLKDLEDKLRKCEEARRMDAEIIKSWQREDKVKGMHIEELRKETQALTTELGKLVNVVKE